MPGMMSTVRTTALTRNPDGTWSGKALRGGAAVDVQVDARGRVTTK